MVDVQIGKPSYDFHLSQGGSMSRCFSSDANNHARFSSPLTNGTNLNKSKPSILDCNFDFLR